MRISFAIAAALGAAPGLGTVSGINKVEVYDDEGNKLFSKDANAVAAEKPKLEPLYFNGEDLTDAVSKGKPNYQVWADSDTGPALAGSGTELPAIRYGSKPTSGMMALMNPDHPYFAGAEKPMVAEQVAAIAREAPTLEKAMQDIKAGTLDPKKLWDTVKSTLPPGDMSFLLHWMGYTVDGKSPLEQSLDYRRGYYKLYGRQAPPPAPRNPEADWLTDAELAAIIAS